VKMVTVTAARTRLSALLRQVSRGETVVITRRNQPVATLNPVPRRRKTLRPWGLYKGLIDIPDDFNEPMLEFERLFHGEKSEDERLTNHSLP
jgi:prevent-host-death family protein